MECPKCKYPQKDSNQECQRCGVIFEKYYQRLARDAVRSNRGQEKIDSISEDDGGNSLWGLVFSTPKEVTYYTFGVRAIVFVVLVVWGARFMFSSIDSNYAGQSLMHLVNLPFHEAGHVFLRPFGPVITSLGGTLGQLLMPLVCLVVLLFKTRDAFGASVALWWFGQNFFDIAPYVNDARSGTLPLLGGNVGHSSPYGFHDWEFILTELGLLRYDHFLAGLAVTVGWILMIVSFTWAGILLFKQFQDLKIS